MFSRHVTKSLRGMKHASSFRAAAVASATHGSEMTMLTTAAGMSTLPVHRCAVVYGGLIPTQTRGFSTINPRITRAFPQYAVHGEDHMLNLKMIPPGYRLVKGESIVMDNSRKGKLLLEFTPRDASGSYAWAEQVRFALSAEEAGLFCSQLPQFEVEFSRSAANPLEDVSPIVIGIVTNDMPDKVLKISPGEGATVRFLLDFVRDGVGGQNPAGGPSGTGPMEVVVQAGEFEVMLAIVKSTLPILAGWAPLIDIAVVGAINETVEGGSGGGRYKGGGNFGNSSPF